MHRLVWVCTNQNATLFGITCHVSYCDYSKNSFNETLPLRIQNIWASAWDFQQCGLCGQQSLRSACAYGQSDQSLCQSLEYSMVVKLLTEHHLECLSLKGGCRGSSESTLVKMPHCWKSHVTAYIVTTKKNSFNETVPLRIENVC